MARSVPFGFTLTSRADRSRSRHALDSVPDNSPQKASTSAAVKKVRGKTVPGTLSFACPQTFTIANTLAVPFFDMTPGKDGLARPDRH